MLDRNKGRVILGVTESDAHVVANRLIAELLRREGYDVDNLGACTSVAEFIARARSGSAPLAIVIGSLNGHAVNDLTGLADEKRRAGITCPIIVGGNLSVGRHKTYQTNEQLLACGVDLILDSYLDIVPTLDRLRPAVFATSMQRRA